MSTTLPERALGVAWGEVPAADRAGVTSTGMTSTGVTRTGVTWPTGPVGLRVLLHVAAIAMRVLARRDDPILVR